MEQSANCSLALGYDMLSRPLQLERAGFGLSSGRENMAPKFNLLLLTRGR